MEISVTGKLDRVAIGDLLRRSAARAPGKTALVEGERRTSFAALDGDACRFAHYLLSRGLKRGDKVAMLCNNSTEMLVAVFGIHKAGLVWVPVNTMLGDSDLRYIVEHSEARFLVVDADILALPARQALVEALGLCIIVTGGAAPAAGTAFAEALVGQPSDEPEAEIAGSDLALIMYTSGTTARPKGVMHSHQSVFITTLSNCVDFDTRRDDVSSAILPLFHCAQYAGAVSALVAGGTVVILRGFNPEVLLSAIERERITRLTMLPQMYAALLAHADRPARDLSSLKLCVYGMAPMPKPLLVQLIDQVCPAFMLGSGQTEMFPVTVAFRPEQQLQRFGNYWGEATLLNDMAIMDDDGNLLPPGQTGEIVHRGPNVMLGYYKDREATTDARRFGWHHTGDLGVVDPDGQLLFVDRKKDMIKSGGENVPSVKVEETLLRHAAIANAAVVGLPHPHWVEAVSAFVVLKPGHSADEAAILRHCREHLGGFEVPKLVVILDEMPMTATGKVRKQELKALHAAHFAAG